MREDLARISETANPLAWRRTTNVPSGQCPRRPSGKAARWLDQRQPSGGSPNRVGLTRNSVERMAEGGLDMEDRTGNKRAQTAAAQVAARRA